MATITGADGADTLIGGVDSIGQPEADLVLGKAGIDRFVLTKAIGAYSVRYVPATARYRIVGPDGNDVLSGVELLLLSSGGLLPLAGLIDLADPVFIGLSSPGTTAGGDLLRGTIYADFINGGAGNDQIAGGKGNDWLFGASGSDTLFGGEGNDSLDGQAGNDQLFGGNGDDLLRGDLIGISGNDLLSGGGGNDELRGLLGDDFLDGGEGDDKLTGGFGSDVLRGGTGNDLLIGDQYTHRYYQSSVDPDGPSNDDVLIGGEGADSLMGGVGADVLAGGGGKDNFVFTGLADSTVTAPDLILDFGGAAVAAATQQGTVVDAMMVGHDRDRIDLSEIDAVTDTRSVNDAFDFIGTAAFSAAGQLRYGSDGTTSFVEGNMDSDLAADFRIELTLINYRFTIFDFIL